MAGKTKTQAGKKAPTGRPDGADAKPRAADTTGAARVPAKGRAQAAGAGQDGLAPGYPYYLANRAVA